MTTKQYWKNVPIHLERWNGTKLKAIRERIHVSQVVERTLADSGIPEISTEELEHAVRKLSNQKKVPKEVLA